MSKKLSESDVFVLLAKRHRRITLRNLQEFTSVTIVELAYHIAEREYVDPSKEDFRTVYLTLYHNHIPRLEDAEVVSYNQDDGTIRPGGNFDVVIHVLEGVVGRDLPWSDA